MNQPASQVHTWPPALRIILIIWFVAACALGLSGRFYGAPAEAIGGINATLTTLSLLALFLVPAFKAWADRVALKTLVLYHLIRFVGIAFLVMNSIGKIPGDFALVAGWGDIAVAVTAIAVAFFALPLKTSGHWRALLLWNIFGLADILIVLRTGITMGFADITQMIWITEFPMSLLPTFLVPLVLVTHVLIFRRLWRHRPSTTLTERAAS